MSQSKKSKYKKNGSDFQINYILKYDLITVEFTVSFTICRKITD